MKKTLALFAAMLSAGFAFADDISEDFTEKAWTGNWTSKPQQIKFSHSKEIGCAQPGAAVIKLTNKDGKRISGAFIKEFKELKPDTPYSFTVKVKGDNDNVSPSLSIQYFDEKGGYRGTMDNVELPNAKDWKILTTVAFIPKEAKSIKVFLAASSTQDGTCYFDDLQIKEEDFTFSVKDEFYGESAKYGKWGFWKGEGSKCHREFLPEVGHDNPGCYAIVSDEGQSAKQSGCLTSRARVIPGKEYTFILFVKAEGTAPDANISLGLQAQDDKFNFLGVQSKSTSLKGDNCQDWKRLVLTFTIPTNGKWAKCSNLLITLGLSNTSTGKAYFDDFEYFMTAEE